MLLPRWHGQLDLSVTSALDDFVAQMLQSYPRLARWHDAEWPSPCEYGEPFLDDQGERLTLWRPVRRARPQQDDLAGLERALETPLHPDIKAYYGAYWSGGLEAEAPEGHVSLILLWNPEDGQRLVENLIGHALAKRQARTPFTVFFACTEPEADEFLSVDNETGQVLLEQPGRKPIRTVAENLEQFLRTLVPAPSPFAVDSEPGSSLLV